MRQRHCLVCKKHYPNLGPRNNVCDKCRAKTVKCPLHPGCQFVYKKYSVHGERTTKVPPHPFDDTTIERFGSIIHWSQMSRANLVPVTCGICRKIRMSPTNHIRFRKSRYTGCHLSCLRKKWLRDQPGFGVNTGYDGYIQKHIDTFSRDEITILKDMFKKWRYVLEHRAVMALHLGRPLNEGEMVHHLDGNRSNNKLENLRLLKVSQHHKGHGDDFYQPYQEALVIIQSLREIIARANL